MAEGGLPTPPPPLIPGADTSTRDMEIQIESLINYLRDEFGWRLPEYRCSTCWNLSSNHPNGDVKGCKKRKLSGEEYYESLRQQLHSIESVVQIISAKEDKKASFKEIEQRLDWMEKAKVKAASTLDRVSKSRV